tara:strand:- start:131055 stop:131327 length:273 start_codon:yes stop_codon:yes gene_type:complete
LVDGKIKNLSSQSIIGTVNNNHNKNNPHIKPIPLITSSKKLLLNLYLNIRKALINKTLIERESGIIESPYHWASKIFNSKWQKIKVDKNN